MYMQLNMIFSKLFGNRWTFLKKVPNYSYTVEIILILHFSRYICMLETGVHQKTVIKRHCIQGYLEPSLHGVMTDKLEKILLNISTLQKEITPFKKGKTCGSITYCLGMWL